MDLNIREKLEIAFGIGKSSFRMSRGSFSYRQILYRRIKLKRVAEKDTDFGCIISFYNKRFSIDCDVYVRDLPGGVTSVSIENYPNELKEKINRFFITLPAFSEESVYGLGETYSLFDLKGQKVRVFVAEHQNAKRITSKIIREKLKGKRPEHTLDIGRYESYCSMPVYTSSRKYFVFCDVDSYCRFDFSKYDSTTIFTHEIPKIYIGTGDTFTELSEKLTSIIGRSPALPSWCFDGAILAMQGGTETIMKKAGAFMEAGGKLSGIWSQDWCGCRITGFGYQVMWNWEWDRNLYPGLDGAIAELKEKGVRFLGYINPFMALEGELYRYASSKGYCVKNYQLDDYLVKITTFPAAMIDLTNPEAWEWYKGVIKRNMIDLGMGGWMADFGEYLPVDCVLYSCVDPYFIHDNWPEMWAKLNMEAITEAGKEDEVFFFTRAAYTRSAGYTPMMWTVDQHVDWSVDDGLPSVITASLSLSMSGFGMSHWDAGGYTTIMSMTRDEELLLRWLELSAFSPMLRTHEGNQPSRNVQFDTTEALMAQTVRMSLIHSNLGKYLMKLSEENSSAGTPVIRPLFYHYDEKPCYALKDEYLLGPDVLVAPVIRSGETKRTVFLPVDRWVHLFSKKEYSGGTHTVDAPVGYPPVFIRAESPDFDELISISDI